MNTLKSIPMIRVWLESDQLISTAKMLLNGYRLPALGIADSSRNFLGFATMASFEGLADHEPIDHAKLHPIESVESSCNARDAAKLMIEREIDFLPVVEEGKYIGLVTARGLLGKLRESYDPMTGLPWSDRLREWGQEQLEQGVEIAMIFIDLNKFGKFNKDYGHVVGDKVLRRLVEHLSSLTNPETDVLVRYGGDEFAIGTTRDREEAETLVTQLENNGIGLTIPESPVPIFFSVGLFGGRRSQPRTDVHIPSNVDNLVNLASKNCQDRKSSSDAYQTAPKTTSELEQPSIQDASVQSSTEATEKTSLPEVNEETALEAASVSAVIPSQTPSSESIQPPMNVPILETIQVDDDENSLTYVVLRVGNEQSVGVGLKMGRTDAESVATATAKAIERSFEGITIVIDTVSITRAGSTELVQIRSRVTKNGFESEIVTEAEANGDLFSTVAQAVISAFQAV